MGGGGVRPRQGRAAEGTHAAQHLPRAARADRTRAQGLCRSHLARYSRRRERPVRRQALKAGVREKSWVPCSILVGIEVTFWRVKGGVVYSRVRSLLLLRRYCIIADHPPK